MTEAEKAHFREVHARMQIGYRRAEEDRDARLRETSTAEAIQSLLGAFEMAAKLPPPPPHERTHRFLPCVEPIPMTHVFEVAAWVDREISRLGLSYAVIGGIALQVWGEPRVTRDLDLSLLTGFGREEETIKPLLEIFPSRRTDALEFALINRIAPVPVARGDRNRHRARCFPL